MARPGPNGWENRVTGRRLRALVAVHTFGHPADLEPLDAVCRRFDLALVEDAAESLGSWYKGRHTGTVGRVGALSFNGNKVITTGGGGAVLTNDPRLAEEAKHLTTTAKRPHRWAFVHDRVGFNYRLPNLNAALGCAQLEALPGFLRRKRALADAYAAALADVRGVRFFTEPAYARSNYWLNTLDLADDHVARRDELLEASHAAGLEARPPWTPLHRLPMYADCPRMALPTAERLAAGVVNIPSSVGLMPAEHDGMV